MITSKIKDPCRWPCLLTDSNQIPRWTTTPYGEHHRQVSEKSVQGSLQCLQTDRQAALEISSTSNRAKHGNNVLVSHSVLYSDAHCKLLLVISIRSQQHMNQHEILVFSVMLGWVFPSWTSTKQRIKCLAQGNNSVPPVRLKPATPRSRVKHYTTEPPRSIVAQCHYWYGIIVQMKNNVDPDKKPADLDLQCFTRI